MKKQPLVILTGSNVGDSSEYLAKALILLEKEFGKPLSVSKTYKTQAWGITEQDDFLNQALVFNSSLNPDEILEKVKSIEKKIGRKPRNTWANREIDIDIVFYGSLIYKSKDLYIPHPLMQLRKFVLKPLAEIIPSYMHPVLKKNVSEILNACEDNLLVEIAK